MWVNLNSLKAIFFKGKFPRCIRNVFDHRWLDILVIIFGLVLMRCILVKIMVFSVGQKKCFFPQPFLKMRKFLFDMRKDFLIMSNFYLVEILSKPNSLAIVASKTILRMINYVLILSIFFVITRIRDLECKGYFLNKRYLFENMI